MASFDHKAKKGIQVEDYMIVESTAKKSSDIPVPFKFANHQMIGFQDKNRNIRRERDYENLPLTT